MYDVITIGSATRDVFLRSRHIKIIKDQDFSTGQAECFALGSKIEIEYILFETGGGATNTAVGFSRQGLRVAFVGRIGHSDGRGREVLHELEDEKVDTHLVVKDRTAMTGYSVLLLTPRGERTVLVYRGASARFKTSELLPRIKSTRWLYVTSLGGDISVMKAMLRQAKKARAKVAWNPGAGELAHGWNKLVPLFKQTAILSLNREEATTLQNSRSEKISEQALFSQLPGITVITEGTGGAVAYYQSQKFHAGIHNIKVVDTTGAGDAFGCGFVGSYITTGGNLIRSLQFATANAESVLQHVGAKDGLLRKFPKKGLVHVGID